MTLGVLESARGVAFLMRTQRKDGSWDEQFYTGTGFPRVFYLMYHLYRQYFPLLALTTYQKVMERNGNPVLVATAASGERNRLSSSGF